MPIVKPIRILLVEDNPGDIVLIRKALVGAKITNGITSVTDGQMAIDFLNNPENPRPSLILLDLQLPKVLGHEVLKFIKSDKDLKQIPVIILTSSEGDADIEAGYSNHANAYIAKPVNVDDFMRAIQGMANFWITIVELP